MKKTITLEIPELFIEKCKERGIAENLISDVYKHYVLYSCDYFHDNFEEAVVEWLNDNNY